MQAALEYPPLGVLGLLDHLLERVRGWAESIHDSVLPQTARVSRVHVLEALRETMVEETRAWCQGLGPDDVPAALSGIGRRHWSLWGTAARYALEMESLVGSTSAEFLSTTGKAWHALAADAHVLLPLLSPTARRDVRSFAKVVATSFDLIAGSVLRAPQGAEQLTPNGIADLFDLPVDRLPEDLLRLNAALEILFVGGHVGGVSDAVTRAAAGWLWSGVSSRRLESAALEQAISEARRLAADAEAPHAREWAQSAERHEDRARARAEAARGYDELRRDPAAWSSVVEVREAWDATLGDGLEEPGA